MTTPLHTASRAIALLIAFVPAIASPVQAESMPGMSGICQMHNLSGYSTVDASGHLIILSDYCNQQAKAQQPQDSFWQAFTKVANADAIAYATTIERREVTAYGGTICPFLEKGGTVADLRQIQADNTLPHEFEVAVTVAAINTYCPDYRAELGR